jgi:hypothetical protein
MICSPPIHFEFTPKNIVAFFQTEFKAKALEFFRATKRDLLAVLRASVVRFDDLHSPVGTSRRLSSLPPRLPACVDE